MRWAYQEPPTWREQGPSWSHPLEAQGLARLFSQTYGPTWPPQPHDHSLSMPLTTLLTVATAALETAVPPATSRRDPSDQPPWPASWAATAWPSRCCWSARAGVRAGVSWHVASKSCGTSERGRAGAVSPSRLYTA